MIKEKFEKYASVENTPAMRKAWAEEARASFDSWFRALPAADKEAIENYDDRNAGVFDHGDNMWLQERGNEIAGSDWDELVFDNRLYNDPDVDVRLGRKALNKFLDYACECIEKGVWSLRDAVQEVFADEILSDGTTEEDRSDSELENFAFELAVSNGKDMTLADMLRQVKRYADMNDPSYSYEKSSGTSLIGELEAEITKKEKAILDKYDMDFVRNVVDKSKRDAFFIGVPSRRETRGERLTYGLNEFFYVLARDKKSAAPTLSWPEHNSLHLAASSMDDPLYRYKVKGDGVKETLYALSDITKYMEGKKGYEEVKDLSDSLNVICRERIIQKYFKSIKQNCTDPKSEEKLLLASKKALESFNEKDSGEIKNYLLEKGATDKDKLVSLLSRAVSPEKRKTQQKRNISGRER